MDEIKSKQQVVEKIKEAGKILVTVSNNPSVDALSAALALTLLLDKQKKYVSAIFSGETPPAIAFLEPEKTFDDTTDSLRDFIIALNKEKADHLRYKVVDDAVKIFITPYKTTITEADLEFSQGDYNVELVIAIGVDDQDHLDAALENHGKILHDAAIITLTAGDQTSDLGGVDWHDDNASSLSEMVTGLAEALKDDKKKSLLDAPIATALLTGIVAETDRFSNQHTTSRVMTVAANLMAAGANQQLIATEIQAAQAAERIVNIPAPAPELEPALEPVPETVPEPEPAEAEVEITEQSQGDEPQEAVAEDDDTIPEPKADEHDATSLAINHHDTLRLSPVSDNKAPALGLEEELQAELELESEPEDATTDVYLEPIIPEVHVETPSDEEPSLGGVLNATADQAEADARRARDDDQNRTILTHEFTETADTAPKIDVSVLDTETAPVQGKPFEFIETPSSSAYAAEPKETLPPANPVAPVASAEPSTPTFAPLPPPPPAPSDFGLPLPPPIPDFAQLNTTPSAAYAVDQPPILGDILAPEPVNEPVVTETLPTSLYAPGPLPEILPKEEPALSPGDPGQFQIPPR